MRANAELGRVKGDIENILPTLGKHKIEELQRVISKHYDKRFKARRKTPKYGTLTKGFNDLQLQAFLRVIENPKFLLLFRYQATLGLRIGEVVKLKVEDINFQSRELTIRTEKAKTLDTLIIPLFLFEQTREFIELNAKAIQTANGHIFYTNTEQSQAGNIYVGVDYARNMFRHYVREASLDEVYDITDEEQGRRPRKLHRLTTHSLRHYAITRFARQTNGNLLLTSRFARHREPNTTLIYISKEKEQLYSEIDKMG